MRLWRVAKRKYALDKSCEGSRLTGVRWNAVGLGVLYAATTIELASLEKFVHTAGICPSDLILVAVDVPDDPSLIHTATPDSLPAGWDAQPGSDAAQDYGSQWLNQGEQLVLLVPSVIVPESHNALINPLHPRYSDVTLTAYRDFKFDDRM